MHQGSFRGRTNGNGILIVKVFKNALWTPLRTTYRPTFTNLHDFAYTISHFFGGNTTHVKNLTTGNNVFVVSVII